MNLGLNIFLVHTKSQIFEFSLYKILMLILVLHNIVVFFLVVP